MRRVLTITLLLAACGGGESPQTASDGVEPVAEAPATPTIDLASPPAAEAHAPTQPPADVVTERRADELPAEARPELPDPAPADQRGTPHAEVDPNAAGLAEVRATGEAIEAALNAAAEQGGSNTCERGYNSLVAMVRELRARTGATDQRNPPPHDAFVEACNDLPPEVQECLVLSYALAHRSECEVRKNSLDPSVRAHIRALMTGEAD